MIRKAVTIAAVALLGLGAASQAGARAVEESDIEKGKEQIEADQGYIYLTAPNRFAGSFIRIADEEDIAAYQEARAAALARAMEQYEKDHERWQRRMERVRAGEEAPEEPQQPTEDSFGFVSIEQFFANSFGPTYVYSKDGGTYAYLEAVKPGTYIWYGPVFYGAKQGYLGQCYCMGTIKFDVAPGVITNLGNSLFAMPRWEDDKGSPVPQIKENSGLNGFVVELPQESGELDYTLPATLASQTSVVPEFSAVGKINNFYRQMIARIAPIDGVIAYDRDRVIDLRAEAADGDTSAAD